MANYIFFNKSFCRLKKSNGAPKKECKDKMFKNTPLALLKSPGASIQ